MEERRIITRSRFNFARDFEPVEVMEQRIDALQQQLREREGEVAQLSAAVQQLLANSQNNQNRDIPINQLVAALQQISVRNPSSDPREKVLKEIRHMSNFTGSGDVSINAFVSSIEYYLNTIQDPELQRIATRTIFFEKIQGGAKDVIINLPEPDNWELIKSTLKLRYKPDTEPSEIYRRISGLKVNSVSELAVELQNIKYKADELAIYYKNHVYIDLTNVESLLVNAAKEMTQGVLLDKIIELSKLADVISVMQYRRFEDLCIRPEAKRIKTNYGAVRNLGKNKNNYGNREQNQNSNKPHYKNDSGQAKPQTRQNYSDRQSGQNDSRQTNYKPNYDNKYNSNQYNNKSGQYNKSSNNYRNFKQNSDSRRQHITTPMEVDNVQQSDQTDPKITEKDSRQHGSNKQSIQNEPVESNLVDSSNEGRKFFMN